LQDVQRHEAILFFLRPSAVVSLPDQE
jgi:hypothetical protein